MTHAITINAHLGQQGVFEDIEGHFDVGGIEETTHGKLSSNKSKKEKKLSSTDWSSCKLQRMHQLAML
jgi:hypothetical protein